MNIDQGFFGGPENVGASDPTIIVPDQPPRLPPKDASPRTSEDSLDSPDSDSGSSSSSGSGSEPDTSPKEQYDPLRAFGRSLWNASTLALAVESRTRGGVGGMGGMPGIVCVPGEY